MLKYLKDIFIGCLALYIVVEWSFLGILFYIGMVVLFVNFHLWWVRGIVLLLSIAFGWATICFMKSYFGNDRT